MQRISAKFVSLLLTDEQEEWKFLATDYVPVVHHSLYSSNLALCDVLLFQE
jgi:hypothetical protein